MDEKCFRPFLCTVKAELGLGQPGLMRWIWDETVPQSSISRRKGKIGQGMLSIIHVILPTRTQYLLSQILQTKLPAILDTVVCRHANLPYINCMHCFSIPYSVFGYNFLYKCNILNLHHKVLKCNAKIDAVLNFSLGKDNLCFSDDC